MLEPFVTLLVATFAASLMSGPSQAADVPTLAQSLQAAHVPIPAGANGAERVWNVGSLDDSRWFVIAYYDETTPGVKNALHVRAFDKRRRLWRSVRHDYVGSVVSIERRGSLFYLTGHTNPSAAPTLVLDERLAVRRELDGWPMLFLADGRLVFSRSMIHFAPTHAQVLAIYDPVANRDVTFYPAGVDNFRGNEEAPGTDLRVERSIGEVTESEDRRAIAFDVRTQRMRVDARQIPEPAGPEESFRVTCSTASPRPTCRRP